MTDAQTPAEQVQTPPQQANEENWKARFDGAVRKMDAQAAQIKDLLSQLDAKTSEAEQLRVQLGVKDAEKTSAISERDKQLQSTITSKTQLEQELSDLRGFKLKVDVAKELGQPGLLKIIDKLPNMTDREALKSVLSDFANFASEAALEREKQLLAGGTPSLGQNTKTASPSSDKEWEAHINSLPLGSREREIAFDKYWDWGQKTNAR